MALLSGRSAQGLFRIPSGQVTIKFSAALAVAFTWTMFSVWLSARWMEDLGDHTHPLFALVAITFIAYVPGFMNAFLMTTLLLDRRPSRKRPAIYPGVSILIAAYQEGEAIADTLSSIAASNYPGELELLVLNDGSTDDTGDIARRSCAKLGFPRHFAVRVVDFPTNRGKAAVLNSGLEMSRHGLVGGLVFYLLVYTVMMQPICVWGYVSELAGRAKNWGTK